MTASAPQPRPHRWSLGVGIVIPVVYVAGAGFTAVFATLTPQEPVEGALLLVGFGLFAVLGGLLVARRPANVVGWLLSAIGWSIGVLSVGPAYVEWLIATGRQPTGLQALAAWPNAWSWYLTLGLTFVALPLLFPDGRLPSRRWMAPAVVAGLSILGACTLGAVQETIPLQSGAAVPNPLGIAGVGYVEDLPAFDLLGIGLVVGMVSAVASLGVRFRRSRGRERAQVKWLLFGASLALLLVVPEVMEAFDIRTPDAIENVTFVVVLYAVPCSVALAVLRYRLYDIDRIISRTVGYALLTGVLVAVYAGGVVLSTRLLVPLAAGSDLAVAAGTLGAAAAFSPARRRIQTLVDRRFNRASYDAERELEAFRLRLRDEFHVGEIGMELEVVAGRALEPSALSLWLAPRRR